MPFWKIAWRNIEQRSLASALTALSMALGVAVMIAVIVIYNVTVRQFEQNAQGYHLIVGGKGGGPLQLVLSTVYYVSNAPYPIPYTYYQKFQEGGEFAGYTKVAVPECLGDSYEAPDGSFYRVVATTPDLFDKLHYGNFDDGTPKLYEFAKGRNFKNENFQEAVCGSVVAAKSGLKIADEIQPTHGISPEGHKHEGFKIVGILKPTGTANDRAVFINIEGFYLQENHARTDKAHAAAEKPANEKVDAKADVHHDHEKEHDTKADAKADDHHDHEPGYDEKDHDEKDHAAKATAGDGDHDHADDDHATADPAVAKGEQDHDHKDADDHDHEPAATKGHDHAAHDHGDHDHEHEHEHTPLPTEQREVTSILVLAKSELASMGLERAINKSDDGIAAAVSPTREVTSLLDKIVGPIRLILLVLTVLIVIVAGISILVSIYNSMSERSHDIAVMRALGASRGAVMSIVLVESILLSLGGGLVGVLLGHGVIGLVAPYVVTRTGVSLSFFEFDWQELVLIPGLVLLASLVGFLPALAAYRTDVAKALAGGR